MLFVVLSYCLSRVPGLGHVPWVFDNLHWTIVTGAVAGVSISRWRRSEAENRPLFACLATGMSMYFGGQLAWDLEVVLGKAQFPGPPDLFCLQAGFWISAGFLTLSAKRLRGAAVGAISLDIGMITLAAFCITLSLYAPRFTSETLLTKVVMVAYPVSLFTAFGAGFCALIVLRLRPTWGNLLFLFSLLGDGVCWGAWNYIAISGGSRGGSVSDYALSLCCLAAGLGIALMETERSSSHRWERLCVEIQRVLPLVMALVGTAAIVLGRSYAFAVGFSADLSVLFIISAALVTHALMLYERDQLLRTKLELEQSETRFQAIFRQSNQFLAVVSTQGVLLDVNDSATLFAGVDSRDVIGKPFADTPWWNLSAEEQAKIRLAIQVAANGSIYTDVATRVDAQGDTHTIEYNVSPARDRDGKVAYVVAAGVDVTERRQMELQLQQAQKLEAIGQLAGGVAHDFNNLLTIIIGYSELLLMEKTLPPEHHSALKGVLEAAQRGEYVARQLLLFSRRHVHETRVLNLNEILNGVERLLARLLPENISLVFEPDEDIGPITADPGQVEQIVFNLAINARDAMESGGRLKISTRNLRVRSDGPQHQESRAPGRYAQLVVADNGCGMTPEVLRRAFEPFFTTKAVGRGTGLGLATVYGCVTQNNGHIEIDSMPGVGTTFTITWPVMAAAGDAKGDSGRTKSLHPGTETILLVEDEEGVRNLASRVLSTHGYRVLAAPNAEAALRLAREHKGDIDLLVTDMIMPGLSGKELCATLRAERPGLQTLLISGYIDDEFKRESACGTESGFLQKPFTIAALLGTVREILHPEAALK